MGFVFYDTETTGTDTSFDQILQFAAIRTDDQLNELERFEIRCRLLPHIVPAPGAMRVTGVRASQLFSPALPSHYEMIRRIRSKLLEWSPALFIGYNSLDFDEHLFRQSLYMTLHPPYLTNTNGNSRSDALRMVQAASIFAPDALTFAVNRDGSRSFKLDRVAPANGFNHEHAHDALADVEATIFICRRLMESAPDVWSSFMRFSQRASVADFLESEQTFCLSEFYFGKPYSWIVTNIGSNPEIKTEHFVFDLANDPNDFVTLSDEDLARRLAKSPKPVRRIKGNAAPIIRSSDDAPLSAVALQLGMDELNRRAELLQENDTLRQRLIRALLSTRADQEESEHVEKQIYNGFFSGADQKRLDAFHLAPWEERPRIVNEFEDQRLRTIGRRLLYIERPDLLSQEVCAVYEKALVKRILGERGDEPWLTLQQAITEIETMFQSATGDDRMFLKEHHEHLKERQRRASESL
jgi:exodeoxyribonuclease-1